MLWLTFYTFDEGSGEISNTESFQKGTISGSIDLNGVFIFQAIVCLVNIKILIKMNHYDCLGVLWILISIGLFYACFFWLNGYQYAWGDPEKGYTYPYPLFAMMGLLATFENQYFLLFFFTTAYFLIEFGVKILDAEINNGIQEFKFNQKMLLQ